MLKKTKKKCASKRLKTESSDRSERRNKSGEIVKCAEQTKKQWAGTDQSGNSNTGTNQSDNQLNKIIKVAKVMKNPYARPKYLHPRSKSVPTKTVSFSPFVLHRFAHGPVRVKADTCRHNTCSGCRLKPFAKKSAPYKRRTLTEKCTSQQMDTSVCMQNENACSHYDQSLDTSSNLGVHACHIDPVCPVTDYIPGDNFPSSSHNFNLGCRSKSPSTSFSVGDSVLYPAFQSNACRGSTYISELATGHSPWRSRHISPGIRSLGTEVKFDYLMAKYSEHNCPKTHPARADYFSLQKSPRAAGQGNLSANKSPSSSYQNLGTQSTRSLSQTRTPIGRSSRSSIYSYSDNIFTGMPTTYNYSGLPSYSTYDSYQSDAMRDLMYDSLSRKYLNNLGSASVSANGVMADKNLDTGYYSGMAHPNVDSITSQNRHRSSSRSSVHKYDFTDDMMLINRSLNASSNSAMPFTSAKNSAYCIPRRSRSSDASIFSGAKSYGDKEINGPYAYGNFEKGETGITGMSGNYDRWKHKSRYEAWKNGSSKYKNYTPASFGSVSSILNHSYSKSPIDDTDGKSITPRASKVLTCSLRDNKWTGNKNSCSQAGDFLSILKTPDALSYSKLCDTNTLWKRFDDCDVVKRIFDKYSILGTSGTSTSDHGGKACPKDTREAGLRSGHTPDYNPSATSSLMRDFTPAVNTRRDRSPSPVTHRSTPGLYPGHRKSYFLCGDKDNYVKHSNSDIQGTRDTKLDTFTIATERNGFEAHNFYNAGPCVRSTPNLNLNHPQKSIPSANTRWNYTSEVAGNGCHTVSANQNFSYPECHQSFKEGYSSCMS